MKVERYLQLATKRFKWAHKPNYVNMFGIVDVDFFFIKKSIPFLPHSIPSRVKVGFKGWSIFSGGILSLKKNEEELKFKKKKKKNEL